MKAMLVVVLVGLLAAQSQAGFLDTIKGVISGTLGDVKEIGKGVLQNLLEHGKNLGKQALQALIGSVMKNLQGVGSTEEDEMNLFNLFKEGVAKFEEALKEKIGQMKLAFGTVMDKIKEIFDRFNPETIEDEIDDVVDLHEVVQRHIFTDLLSTLKEKLGDFLKKGFQAIIGRLTGAGSEQKRFIVPAMNALREWGQKLGDFFKPHVEKLVQHVKTVGGMVKEHASKAVAAVKGALSGMKDKLATHVDKLKEHGKNIVVHGKDALAKTKEAIVDILKETFENMKPHVQGVIDAHKDLVGTVIENLPKPQ